MAAPIRPATTARRARTLLAVGCAALIIAAIWGIGEWTRVRALSKISADAERELQLFVANLQSDLDRYEFLPQVLAHNEKIARLLEYPTDPTRVAEVNALLETVNANVKASATYVMDRTGRTLAASNWRSARSFVGGNFSYRPYFQAAVQGASGRYFALGSTSGKRGYYYAQPVRRGAEVLGVIVVKVSFEAVESAWLRAPEAILVTDYHGVVFISNRPRWRFMTMRPLAPEVRARIRASRQYGDQPLRPLPVVRREPSKEGGRRLTLREANDATPERDAISEISYQVQTAQLPDQKWIVHVLSSTEPVAKRVSTAVAISVLATAIAVLALSYAGQRRRNWRERQAHQRDVEETLRRAREELELRVAQRTAELTRTNQQLDTKIAEHERAAAELRRTRDELVQAAKLAALGQMSAGITHELNQPLAAIRGFADNGRVLIERGRHAEAQANLQTIAELTERMARITGQLKNFARKSSGTLAPVVLADVVDDVLTLVGAHPAADSLQIEAHLPDRKLRVQVDAQRLGQVLLNLVTNAVDAVGGRALRRIELTVARGDKHVELRVSDTGPGIVEADLRRVFEPFFTTKPVGEGLGLGLSISSAIVREFGGTLTAGNRTGGGAEFTLTLPRAAAAEECAA